MHKIILFTETLPNKVLVELLIRLFFCKQCILYLQSLTSYQRTASSYKQYTCRLCVRLIFTKITGNNVLIVDFVLRELFLYFFSLAHTLVVLLLFVLFAYLLVSCTVTCIILIIILTSQGNNDCFLDNIHLASMYLILPKMQKKKKKNSLSKTSQAPVQLLQLIAPRKRGSS